MLETDTNKANKVESSSPGRTDGTEVQTCACQLLTRDFPPSVAQELAMSYMRQF